MSGLLLILSEPVGERFDAAIEVAAASAALGQPVAMLLRGAAAATVRNPAMTEAIALLEELGASIGICQTAMAVHGIAAETLPATVEPTGMVQFLSGRQGWQLLLI